MFFDYFTDLDNMQRTIFMERIENIRALLDDEHFPKGIAEAVIEFSELNADERISALNRMKVVSILRQEKDEEVLSAIQKDVGVAVTRAKASFLKNAMLDENETAVVEK